MTDRAKYLTLVLALYGGTVAVIVGMVAAIFQRAFLDVTVDLAPAIIICLFASIIHGVRHDLDS
ncbi:hypothetical protein [Brachybacterium tyrofermentans]|uniref:Uncharacterized protein n=1 Tax=Brachybacterium tyrofermentans TaxID=47848 RepID=A0ABW0FGJ2_9MICO|nr:hypothetical protein [Brachybacterium tyrofermentans]